MNPDRSLPRGVLALGLAGLVPFLATLAWAAIDPGSRLLASSLFIAYGASILSFLGGTRWGLGLAAPATGPGRFVEAVLPSLLAVAALVLLHRPLFALTLLALGFAMWLALDYTDRRWSAGYRRMRLGISLAVLAMHGAWVWVLA